MQKYLGSIPFKKKTLIKMHPKSPKLQIWRGGREKNLVIKICMTGLQGDPG